MLESNRNFTRESREITRMLLEKVVESLYNLSVRNVFPLTLYLKSA